MVAERCLVGLGANLGNPSARLRWALDELARRLQPQRLRVSPFYRSAPIGPAGQAPYCNAVCELWLDTEPAQLLQALKQIEHDAGRDFNRPRWSARELDLDVLLIGDQVINTPSLIVPHPRITARNFVLAPLLDLVPDAQIPGRGSARLCLQAVGMQGLEAWPEGA